MGYRVLVCTIPGNYPGIPLADEVFYVDTTDKEGCLDIARRYAIDAVCTSGTDVALPALGYIVDTLGLHGPTEKAALYSSNKYLMKQAFSSGRVMSARFHKVYNERECSLAIDDLGLPCVLKVVDSSGSRGIKIVHSLHEVHDAYADIRKYTKMSYVIVEEFLKGIEFGAQAFVYEGKVHFVMPHLDVVYQGATGVPVGHIVPINVELNKYSQQISEESVKAIHALGVDNTAVNIDFILADGKPYVLEIGARCGATGLAELVSLYYGLDYYGIMLKAALGTLDTASFNNLKVQRAACVLLITSEIAGVLMNYNPVIKHQNLYSYSLDYHIGECVPQFKIGPDRMGQVIATGLSGKEALLSAKEIISELNLEIETSSNMKYKDKKLSKMGGAKREISISQVNNTRIAA